jgi:hypothetical protein
MKTTEFEALSYNDLTDVNGGAIGIIGSFLIGGAAGVIVVGGAILLCKYVF